MVSKQETARKAASILCKKNIGFREVNNEERRILAKAFAGKNKVLYGKAYDIIKCSQKIDLANEKEVEANLDKILIYEIKSTSRKNIPKDFSGYFFDLTTAELLVAQSLGDQFKFAFVNIVTKHMLELSINDVYAKAQRVYPKWAIRF